MASRRMLAGGVALADGLAGALADGDGAADGDWLAGGVADCDVQPATRISAQSITLTAARWNAGLGGGLSVSIIG
jgi:hypothetical protein